MATWISDGCFEAGADKDLKNRNGHAALMLTADNGHVEMGRLLLEAGADRDLHNWFGNKALLLSAGNGHVEMARLLLEAGGEWQHSPHASSSEWPCRDATTAVGGRC